MKDEDFSEIYEKYYLYLLNNDKLSEDAKIKCIIKLLKSDNKYYLFSYIISNNHHLISDWFSSIDYFISYILTNKQITKSYKMKLIREMLASNLIDDDKKYINSLK